MRRASSPRKGVAPVPHQPIVPVHSGPVFSDLSLFPEEPEAWILCGTSRFENTGLTGDNSLQGGHGPHKRPRPARPGVRAWLHGPSSAKLLSSLPWGFIGV